MRESFDSHDSHYGVLPFAQLFLEGGQLERQAVLYADATLCKQDVPEQAPSQPPSRVYAVLCTVTAPAVISGEPGRSDAIFSLTQPAAIRLDSSAPA